MSINLNYAVFGLGKYGISVANELLRNGAEVLCVDADEKLVDSLAGMLPVCKCADVTDPDVIKRLGISDFDVVVVAISDNLEASIIATVLCKQAGVKKVMVKCSGEMHKNILEKIGADAVLLPETESGIRLARNLLNSGFSDLIELSDDISMVELNVKPQWVGKNLIELDLRKKYGLNVVAVRYKDDVSIDINPQEALREDVKLIVIADMNNLKNLK